MTLLVWALLGGGALLMISGIENVPLLATVTSVFQGRTLPKPLPDPNAPSFGDAVKGLVHDAFLGSGGSTPGILPPVTGPGITGLPWTGATGTSATGMGLGDPTQPWYAYDVTQAHGVNGELGIDIGTPFGTPITNLIDGVVGDTAYGPWGGDVHVFTLDSAGNAQIEEFLHLDSISVQPGQYVHAGDVIGLSGGQNSGGTHPADPQYSSGPHTEFGLYRARAASVATALDPTPFIQRLVAWFKSLLPHGKAGA